ncbi:MAG: ornithine carbamoyltransferase [Thermodesulfovibrionales bacterium]|nr:ornithine carbamoyltransferase [Thermodesulfovibrionales bacterium]
MMNRHFTTILDLTADEFMDIIDRSLAYKHRRYKNKKPLKNKSIGLFFEKPSTRTRVSFEVAIYELGGNTVNLNPKEMQIGRGETLQDTSRVLSRYLDGIVFRVLSHRTIQTFSECSTIPVINGLSDMYHPCQAIADMMTIKEFKGSLKGIKLAYVGDGNNVANSLIQSCAYADIELVLACPEEYNPDSNVIEEIQEKFKRDIRITADPFEAVKDADVVYTDVWVSMGQEGDKDKKIEILKDFQVNSTLMSHAKKDAIVLHCLPAYRGLEITDEVIDGQQSKVFDQAENRLHTAKAILEFLIK